MVPLERHHDLRRVAWACSRDLRAAASTPSDQIRFSTSAWIHAAAIFRDPILSKSTPCSNLNGRRPMSPRQLRPIYVGRNDIHWSICFERPGCADSLVLFRKLCLGPIRCSPPVLLALGGKSRKVYKMIELSFLQSISSKYSFQSISTDQAYSLLRKSLRTTNPLHSTIYITTAGRS